ncbi:MAG: hypothetical protein LBR51_00395 [Bacteroidales bacterium]|jgi:hypothetical protein|nr:hypothetical protein [Bacteroidales bacterium]
MTEKKTSPFPEWATKYRTKGVELRCINGNYYLYQMSSRWNKEKKRTQKITGKLLGKITEKNGFIESDKARLRREQSQIDKVQVKESGLTDLITDKFSGQIDLLQKHFP